MNRFVGWAGVSVALAFGPGMREAATAPRWAVLAAIAGATVGFARQLTAPVELGALLLLATASLFWAELPLDGLYGLALLAIAAGVFVLGASLRESELERAFAWTGWGLVASSGLCIAQAMGYRPVLEAVSPSGLLGNKNFLAEACLLAVVPALYSKRWWLVAGLLPGLVLPANRGALVAAGAIVFVLLWHRARAWAIAGGIAVVALGTAFAFAPWHQDSVLARFEIWQDAWNGVNWLGHGIGQFYGIFPKYATIGDTMAVRPDNAHNDGLELVYELGGAGFALAGLFAWRTLRGTFGPASLVFAGFLALGLLAFPLHNPVTLWLGMLAAGGCWQRRLGLCAGKYGRAIVAG